MSSDTKAFAPTETHGNNAGQPNGQLASVTVVASAAATPTATALVSTDPCVRIANKTTAWAHVTWGAFGSVTAATLNNVAVAPGSVEVFTVGGASGFSVILDNAPGTATSVMFTKGNGV